MLAGILSPRSPVCGAELTGNANVDSATKIEAMNQSANESTNVSEQKGTRLLILFDKGSIDIASSYSSALQTFARYMKTHPQTIADIFGHSDLMSGKPADIELAQA